MSKYYFVSSLGLGCVAFSAHSMSKSAMKESPVDALSHNKSPYRIVRKQDLTTLKSTGMVIIDNVISESKLKSVHKVLNDFVNINAFGVNENNDSSVRDDLVFWISESIGKAQKPSSESIDILSIMQIIRSIPYEMQELGFVSENPFGVPFANQVSCYDSNKSHYIAHRDNPILETSKIFSFLSWFTPEYEDREITIILYLNAEKWESGDCNSGNLKLYIDADANDITGDSAKSIIFVEPVGGRLVIFDSKRILHEVCPSHSRRFAMTCWVGGDHSKHKWLRPFCIDLCEVDWRSLFDCEW